MSAKEASSILGISEDEYHGMAKKDLVRLYRVKAKELHPDKGGGHEAFIRLAEAYKTLISLK